MSAALALSPEELQAEPPKPERSRRARSPVVYVVEEAPSEPDPRAAERVLAWLARRLAA